MSFKKKSKKRAAIRPKIRPYGSSSFPPEPRSFLVEGHETEANRAAAGRVVSASWIIWDVSRQSCRRAIGFNAAEDVILFTSLVALVMSKSVAAAEQYSESFQNQPWFWLLVVDFPGKGITGRSAIRNLAPRRAAESV
jgi:hypothetical protein